MNTIPGYCTINEAAVCLGLSNAGAAKAARTEGWLVFRVGNVHLYRDEDIRIYHIHRQRTRLVKALGWGGRGLYRTNDIDIECPVCGSFAIEWPAPPYLPERFMCIDGHEGIRN